MITAERTGASAAWGELKEEEAESEPGHEPRHDPARQAAEGHGPAGGEPVGGRFPLPVGGHVEPEPEAEEETAAEAAQAVDRQAGHDQQQEDTGADDDEAGLGEAASAAVALDPGGQGGQVVSERLRGHRPQCPPPVSSAPTAMIMQTVRLRIR
jgi:hypothetical protein